MHLDLSFAQEYKWFCLYFFCTLTSVIPVPFAEDVFFFQLCIYGFSIKKSCVLSCVDLYLGLQFGLFQLSCCCCYLLLLLSYMKLGIVMSRTVKNHVGILMRIALNLQIAIVKMSIFTMLNLLIHKHGISFHLLTSSSISSFKELKVLGQAHNQKIQMISLPQLFTLNIIVIGKETMWNSSMTVYHGM